MAFYISVQRPPLRFYKRVLNTCYCLNYTSRVCTVVNVVQKKGSRGFLQVRSDAPVTLSVIALNLHLTH